MGEIEIIKWGAYVLVGIIGWFVRVMWEAQKEMRDDLREIEKNISENYMKSDHIKEMVGDLKEDIRNILTPVVNKMEKLETYLLDKNK